MLMMGTGMTPLFSKLRLCREECVRDAYTMIRTKHISRLSILLILLTPVADASGPGTMVSANPSIQVPKEEQALRNRDRGQFGLQLVIEYIHHLRF